MFENTSVVYNTGKTGIHVLHVTTTITMADNVTNTVQKSYIDQGSETNISSAPLYATGHVRLTRQTQPLNEKGSNKSLCPAC